MKQKQKSKNKQNGLSWEVFEIVSWIEHRNLFFRFVFRFVFCFCFCFCFVVFVFCLVGFSISPIRHN